MRQAKDSARIPPRINPHAGQAGEDLSIGRCNIEVINKKPHFFNFTISNKIFSKEDKKRKTPPRFQGLQEGVIQKKLIPIKLGLIRPIN